MPGPPTPVFILTGFLGSGKTTLLNRAVHEPEFSDSAVIVNEFGAIGLDHRLIAAARDHVVLLDSGCLCCALGDSFRETLANLYGRRARGEVPAFTRVLVETSGLADPTPLLQTVMKDTVVAPFFTVGGVVTVVDAVYGLAQLADHDEARSQVAVADRVVISKTELVPRSAVAALTARLCAINASAAIGPVPAAPGPVAGLFRLDRIGQPKSRPRGHSHAGDITAESFAVAEAVTWAGVAAWTGHLRERWGDDLLRCKALLPLCGGGMALVQGVRRSFDITRADHTASAEGCAVCIGRSLDRAALTAGLSWLAAPEGIALTATAGRPPWAPRWEEA